MPYPMGIPYRDGEAVIYDSGDFAGGLANALEAVGGLAAFRARQRTARAQGRYLGLGIACYVEGTGVGPFESATVRIEPNGKGLRRLGRVSAGAGHGDDLCPGGRGHLVGRSRGRRHRSCRHICDRHRLRHPGKPQHGHAVGSDPPRE